MCDCDCELPKRERWALIKRDHAHELAEKIREHADSEGLDYYSPQGLREAADLIDPEVQ